MGRSIFTYLLALCDQIEVLVNADLLAQGEPVLKTQQLLSDETVVLAVHATTPVTLPGWFAWDPVAVDCQTREFVRNASHRVLVEEGKNVEEAVVDRGLGHLGRWVGG